MVARAPGHPPKAKTGADKEENIENPENKLEETLAMMAKQLENLQKDNDNAKNTSPPQGQMQNQSPFR